MVSHLVLAICHFQLHKKWCLQNFYSIKKWVMLEINDNSFGTMTTPDNLVFIWRYFLCSVHSMWFVKCVSFAKIWFVKISARIVKSKLFCLISLIRLVLFGHSMNSGWNNHRSKWLQQILRTKVPSIFVLFSTF